MLSVHFNGWFQCRLATDPDRFDDPRGQNGWTFAVEGEPDLDRIIRFLEPVASRSHGPQVGVFAREVFDDDEKQPDHPLIGASVELLENAVFEGRNGQIAQSAEEPIVPFHLRIAQGSVVLDGFDPIDLGDVTQIQRRQPGDFEFHSPEAAQSTGIADPLAFRRERCKQLQGELAAATDPIVQSALNQRLAQLTVESGIQVASLGFKLTYRFDLRGPNRAEDAQGVLGVRPGEAWPIEFWMGAWDADALCAFTKGVLQVPVSG